MISPAEIAKLAHRLGVGDRVIEKDYVLSWLMVAIAESELRHKLAFKGGTALKKCYYSDYRYSEDLDFTLIVDLSHDDLVNDFEGLFPWLGWQVNLNLTLRSAEPSIFESTTLLIDYVGPLRAQLGSRNLKVDITRGELLLHPPIERPLQASYSDYPADVTMPTYTLEEILTEKLCALMGRTEPRDLYDVYWLFEWSDVDTSFLPANFAAKCQHKGYDPNRLNEALVQSGWTRSVLNSGNWRSFVRERVEQLDWQEDVLRDIQAFIITSDWEEHLNKDSLLNLLAP